ncbi:MAG: ABC transporter permease subunit [Clostridiales Family XIII bacterium]|jgi:NitT/TauT family transport system permease protein|nr:ABC transporter permease subunit [Clostridiales Family XIII bacterium]
MGRLRRLTDSNLFVTIVWIAALVCVWEIAASYIETVKRTPENVLPHLWQIGQSVVSTKPVAGGQTALQIVLTAAAATLSRAGLGFVIGAGLGFVLALLMKLSGIVEKIAFPYLMIIQMIPILGMAPIVLGITGDIGVSRVAIAAILTFYPVAANTLAGLKSTEPEKDSLFRSYAATLPQTYVKLYIPVALPYLFTGLKIAAPLAVTASILVDTLQGDGGLGCMLSQSLKHAMSIFVFWQIVFLSAIVGVLSLNAMVWLERLVLPNERRKGKWNKASEAESAA